MVDKWSGMWKEKLVYDTLGRIGGVPKSAGGLCIFESTTEQSCCNPDNLGNVVRIDGNNNRQKYGN